MYFLMHESRVGGLGSKSKDRPSAVTRACCLRAASRWRLQGHCMHSQRSDQSGKCLAPRIRDCVSVTVAPGLGVISLLSFRDWQTAGA